MLLYEEVFRKLDERGIRYLVIGGVAVYLHGYARITGDLDIMVSFADKDLKKFVALIDEIRWRPRLPVSLADFATSAIRESWIKKKGMKVFSIYDPKKPLLHIDVMVEKFIDFESAYSKRELMRVDDFNISVIDIDNLIKLKKIAGRGRDKIDILALQQIKRLKNAKKKKKI